MAQKTAVQCLIDELKSGKNLQFVMTKCGHLITVHDNIFDKILQMEEQQHQETFKQSRQAKIFEDGMPPVWESFEQYYNETFGNK